MPGDPGPPIGEGRRPAPGLRPGFGGGVPLRRARKNFRIQLPRYLGIALALTAAVAAVLLSCSSQRIVQEQIARFEEANTAFSWGQIPLEEAPGIRNSYAQYALPQCRLDFDGKQVSVPGKRFGSIATESVNLGQMPGKGEIALTPSLARQFAQDIRTLIGRELTFSCGNFVRNLRISGVYSGSFDDYYLDADTEQQLYRTLRDKGDPVSVSYQAADFASVVTAADWLEAQGYAPVTASGQVQSLQETFARLQGGFVLVSVFIAAVSLAICGLLLVKMTRLRGREMGLFLALGYRRRQMRQMLLWESLLLSGLCAMTAAGAMLVLSALSPVLPIRIAPGQWAAGICASAVLVCAMTALSNEKLLHTDPASVLRQ